MILSLVPICDENDHLMEYKTYTIKDVNYTSYCGVCDKACLSYLCHNCTYVMCYECHAEQVEKNPPMADDDAKQSMTQKISDELNRYNRQLKEDDLADWSAGIRSGELYYYNKKTKTRSSYYPSREAPPPSPLSLPLTLEPVIPVRAKSRLHKGAHGQRGAVRIEKTEMTEGHGMNRPPGPIGRPGRYGRVEKTERYGRVEIAEPAPELDLSVQGLAMKLFNQMRETAIRLNLY